MKEFPEQDLNFAFPDEWQVLKFDNSVFYRTKCNQLEGFKGVDFLIHCQNLLFIEVKDFNLGLPEKGKDVPGVVAHKVKDTLAALAGGIHCGGSEANWRELLQSAINKRNPPIVIFLMEDLKTKHIAARKAKRSTYLKILKKNLKWLVDSKRLFVVGLDNYQSAIPLDECTISRIGGTTNA